MNVYLLESLEPHTISKMKINEYNNGQASSSEGSKQINYKYKRNGNVQFVLQNCSRKVKCMKAYSNLYFMFRKETFQI